MGANEGTQYYLKHCRTELHTTLGKGRELALNMCNLHEYTWAAMMEIGYKIRSALDRKIHKIYKTDRTRKI